MTGRIRNRLTYANLMATIAVFVSLGGSSYAALQVTGSNVPRNALTGADIKKLTGRDVTNNSLTGADVKNLTGGDVANGSLLGEDFAAGQLPRGAEGPRGQQGPRGERGLQGLDGAPGPPGLSGLELVSKASEVNANSPKLVVVECPGTKKVVGAGAEIGAGNGQVVLDDLIPSNNLQSLVVNAYEDETGLDQPWLVTGYAICAEVS